MFSNYDLPQDQRVIITSFRMDHIRPHIYIQEFRQKLFYALPHAELIDVARAMLNSAYISANKKDLLQVRSKCVEEV